ncbi:MAG TPA: YihY/virulence factor BrkB family protein [Gemmatimonadales bacterium]|jgi:membrane protein|nr:YihY/virulence factor BrkB family protein [Gemmatimonadales bacterium]
MRHARTLLLLFRAAASGWWDDNVPRLGASLSYYTLFAIAPILLVAIAVAGLVFGVPAVEGRVVGQIQGLIGRTGAEAVQALLQGASRHHAGVIATVVGSATFALAAIGAFMEMQAILNTIWHVEARPHAEVKQFMLSRARAFGLMVATGFLLLVSLVVSAALDALGTWVGNRPVAAPAVWMIVNIVISLIVVTTLFALLYRFLPDVELRWRDVLPGAVMTAVLFTVGKELIGLYLGQGSVASSYGAAGSVIVLLLWVYYASQIVLFGAEFVRADVERRLGKPPLPRATARRRGSSSRRSRYDANY